MEGNKTSREILKEYFRAGKIPLQEHFFDLIASGINQEDDGLGKSKFDPLKITVAQDEKQPAEEVLKFYSGFDAEADWTINLNPKTGNKEERNRGFNIRGKSGKSRFFIDEKTGNIGIGTTKPQHKLHLTGGSLIIDNKDEKNSIRGQYHDRLLQINAGPDNTSPTIVMVGKSRSLNPNRIHLRVNYEGEKNKIYYETGLSILPVGEVLIQTTDEGTKNTGIASLSLVGIKTKIQKINGKDTKVTNWRKVQLQAVPDGNNYGSKMLFLTRDDGGKMNTQMTINHKGNVGIGATDPKQALHVKGYILVNKTANNKGAKEFLTAKETPKATVLMGGVWKNNLYFYFKGSDGKVYRHLLEGVPSDKW